MFACYDNFGKELIYLKNRTKPKRATDRNQK